MKQLDSLTSQFKYFLFAHLVTLQAFYLKSLAAFRRILGFKLESPSSPLLWSFLFVFYADKIGLSSQRFSLVLL